MLRIIISSVILTLFVISCKTPKEQASTPPSAAVPQQEEQKPEETDSLSEDLKSDSPVENLILGEWYWQKTVCCGRTPSTETPETLKMAKGMNFQSGGMVQFSWGEQNSTQTFKISYGFTPNDDRPFIVIGGGQPGLLVIKGDLLIIDYGYMDLQREFYVRKK